MKLFRRHTYNNLNEAVAHADNCTSLRLQFISYNLADKGQEFQKLHRLTELYIQGNLSIYEDYTFKLPTEMGQLQRLQKLTLLNLPLTLLPHWISQLTNLTYLMVRGTDLTFIPNEIRYLERLKTLRVENCGLQTVPNGLAEMHQLKQIGFCDTKLTQIKASMFPSKLKTLDFSGTGCYSVNDILQLKSELKNTFIHPKF